MKKATCGVIGLRLSMILVFLFSAFCLHAADPSYELYVNKKVTDAFSIHEYANKENRISSVEITDPYLDSDKYLADIYISTEKHVDFIVTSLGGFVLSTATGGRKIPYDLFAVTELSSQPIRIRGTSSRFHVKTSNAAFENAFGFSLKLRLDNQRALAAAPGEYSDTLQLTMVVTE